MLGSGFPEESIERGIELGADAIAIDAGSTDSGPYYLGTGASKSMASAVKRDLRVLLTAAISTGIPLVVGSCGTSGVDAGVDWTRGLVEEIATEERLSFSLACIYSEQSADALAAQLGRGRIRALRPVLPLDDARLYSCQHIVGVMGHEPILEALDQGANVVLAGRASDTALVASIALRAALPAGPAWHAAKTVECGDQCTTSPRGAGVIVAIDRNGFTVAPLDPLASCTPRSVAAHMLYENANPFRLVEPSGVLDTSAASYRALDDRTVRVEGSLFELTPQPTIKLEGSAVSGYETISFAGIVDPHVLEHIDAWSEALVSRIHDRVRNLLDLEPARYAVQLRCFGHNAVLGPMAVNGGAPQEVGVLVRVRADDQATATAIAKTANPLLLHLPLPEMEHLPSYAFVTSPAEIERGATYEFVLNHVLEVDDPAEPFRTVISKVTNA
jgi:Acyclic terpene utilisation family protein AtuA